MSAATLDPTEVFTEQERGLWAPPEQLTVSEHADRYRKLSDRESAEPGDWDTGRTPYLRGPQDDLGDPDCDVMVLQKPAQVGGSESARNGLFFWARNDPGPCMIVFPDQDACEANLEERIKPMVRNSLQDVQTEKARDLSVKRIRLTSMDIYAAWATSPSRLASRPCRYIIFDEVNKFPEWSAKDADPIALGIARTRTYQHRAKIVIVSTPTYSDGAVSRAFRSCEDQREAQLPCPDCGVLFAPKFGCVKWPAELDRDDPETPSRIETERLAWLECPECEHQITEGERLSILHDVHWTSITEIRSRSRNRGYRFGVLVTPWTSIHRLAAKFLRVREDPQALMEFITQDLGEEFEDQVRKLDDAVLEEKRLAATEGGFKRGVVPAWAGAVVAAVDSQKSGFWWLARAFGRMSRSRLLDYGFARTFEELEILLLERQWPVELLDGDVHEVNLRTALLAIDARGGTSATESDGSRTDEVYRWSRRDPRIRPFMGYGGHGKPSRPIVETNTNYTPPAARGSRSISYKVMKWTIDTNHFKDVLHYRIDHEDPSLWEVFNETEDDYYKQIRSEHKVAERRGRATRYVWKIRSGGLANHLLDCEVYATAAAVMLQADHFSDVASLRSRRQEEAARRVRERAVETRGPLAPIVDRSQSGRGSTRGPMRGPRKWVDGKGWNRR